MQRLSGAGFFGLLPQPATGFLRAGLPGKRRWPTQGVADPNECGASRGRNFRSGERVTDRWKSADASFRDVVHSWRPAERAGSPEIRCSPKPPFLRPARNLTSVAPARAVVSKYGPLGKGRKAGAGRQPQTTKPSLTLGSGLGKYRVIFCPGIECNVAGEVTVVRLIRNR